MAAPPGFDVLVVGSGASGLAAAVSAERAGARVAVAAKGSLQSCNSAKAQGGILAGGGAATQKRLLQVGDRTGHAITKGLREAWEGSSGTSFEHSPLRELEPT